MHSAGILNASNMRARIVYSLNSAAPAALRLSLSQTVRDWADGWRQLAQHDTTTTGRDKLNVQIASPDDDGQHRALVQALDSQLLPFHAVDVRGRRSVLRMGVPFPEVADCPATLAPAMFGCGAVAERQTFKEKAKTLVRPSRLRRLRHENVLSVNGPEQQATSFSVVRTLLNMLLEDLQDRL